MPTNHWKRFRVCEREGKGLPGTALADDSWLRRVIFDNPPPLTCTTPFALRGPQLVALSWKALGAHFFLTVKSSIGQQHYIMSSTEETSADMPTQEQQQQQQTIEGMDAVRDYERHRDGDEENLTEAEKQMRDEELSFYSNSENEYGDDNIWGLLSGVGGNIYEW